MLRPEVRYARADDGEQSPPFLRNAAQAAAERMPNGRLAVLPGQTHDLNPDATAPVMAEFLAS